jgi:hypothetical protein
VELAEEGLSRFFSLTSPFLDERQRRLLAASMVEVLGRGGPVRVAEATGMSRNTPIAGAKDLAEGPVPGERIRRPGAGPERKIDLDPELLVVLDWLIEPESRGDPMSPLRWTLKSTRVLAAELTRLGHKVGANLVGGGIVKSCGSARPADHAATPPSCSSLSTNTPFRNVAPVRTSATRCAPLT